MLIADDQALVRAGFRAILETRADIKVVGEAVDGHDAVDLARRRRPDVVLMDVKMPGLDGLQATRRILEASPAAPIAVLILTTFDLDEYVYEALRAGASGFLLKDAPPEQLIDAIHTLAAGEALIAPAITKRLIARFARTVPPSRAAAGGARRAHAARAGGARADRAGALQPRDRRRARAQRGHGEDARQARAREARRP